MDDTNRPALEVSRALHEALLTLKGQTPAVAQGDTAVIVADIGPGYTA